MGRLDLFGAIFAFAIFSGSATAAEVELLDLAGEVDIVSVKGEITDGDSDRFYDLVNERERLPSCCRAWAGL